ncbi:4'-phosphopantetheinyl transferase superfamily protein [Streptomyces sp. NBC_00237]|uniref:4'-phosphopantetheinyl transferase family protein n=1 Tax=Streptomyces sp. NBC_00237 TaxID=2975687 RepID=UPI00225ACE44|nr:4'-phosphopantetheinyl transferase superfamily protein [Streptomyces sp. NBC_00237]MCX5205972.1 4'-phosphopantetheinyl transferase superfamily protein [Streptomyces sp. NBC_00237]
MSNRTAPRPALDSRDDTSPHGSPMTDSVDPFPSPGLMHQQVACSAGRIAVWWCHDSPAPDVGRGRALLSHAIAHDYERSTHGIVFTRDAWGRPALAPGQGLPPLSLSVSRRGTLTVAAVAEGIDIGIGAEHLTELPAPPLLRYALTAKERAGLSEEPEAQQNDSFCTLWAAKEAVAHAIGWPRLRALIDIDILLHPRPHLARLGKDRSPQGWEIVPLPLPSTRAAVVLAALLRNTPHPAARSAPHDEASHETS